VYCAVAEVTSVALLVYSGVVAPPPLPCPDGGKDQLANVTGVAQEEGGAGLELTTNESVAKLPVSIDVLMKRFPDVLL
jgi:hypothetical protein